MGVERCDYYSDEEYQQALQEEERSWQQDQQPEPNVIPCHGCGCQIYEEHDDPKYNFCQACKNIINNTEREDIHQNIDDLLF